MCILKAARSWPVSACHQTLRPRLSRLTSFTLLKDRKQVRSTAALSLAAVVLMCHVTQQRPLCLHVYRGTCLWTMSHQDGEVFIQEGDEGVWGCWPRLLRFLLLLWPRSWAQPHWWVIDSEGGIKIPGYTRSPVICWRNLSYSLTMSLCSDLKKGGTLRVSDYTTAAQKGETLTPAGQSSELIQQRIIKLGIQYFEQTSFDLLHDDLWHIFCSVTGSYCSVWKSGHKST